MFHFFEKNREFVRCEINEDRGGRWHIVITEPNGLERTEQFTSSASAHQRWRELRARFSADGWFGPYGRE
jgi:hypothetical protein